MKNSFPLISASLFLMIFFAGFLSAQQKIKSAPPELDYDEPGEEQPLNRALWERVNKSPYETAIRHIEKVRQTAGTTTSVRVTLPNNWQIAPAGTQTEVGRLPFEAVAFGGKIVVLNTGYYNKEPQEVSVVNPDTRHVVKILRLPGLFPSATVGADNDLYISGGISQKIFRYNLNFDTPREYDVGGYTAGLSVVDAEHLAVLYLVTAKNADDFQKGNYQPGKLAILNTKSGTIERETGIGYFPQTVKFLNNKFYVAVSGENKLLIFDAQLKPILTVPTGQIPQNFCADGNHLYIVNSNSDDISVIDTKTDKIAASISLRWHEGNYGSAPTSCVVENNRLYVSQAYTNSVGIFDLKTNRLLGYIPTAWYPTKILLQSNQLLIVSAKGVHPVRPNVDGPQNVAEGMQYVLTLLKGSLGFVSLGEIKTNLAAWTHEVQVGKPFFNLRQNLKSPIKHVFYIVRENRSYDQVMGDLQRGNGDPFLTLFGRDTTPNAHQLSEEFVTLDNFYADGEISVLGHSFTTSGYASPFLEWLGNNAYSGRYSGYPFGMVPVTTSPAYLWDALDDKKINYRIYGENYFLYTRADRILRETLGADSEIRRKFYAQMMQLAAKVDRGNTFYRIANEFYGQADTPAVASRLLENLDFSRAFSDFLCGDESLVKPLRGNENLRRRFAEYLARYPSNYRSWDLNTSDLERAAAWKTDFDKQIQKGDVANLNYLWLPNDHTGGTDNRYLPPEQLVAQNDAALGFIVDTIASSSIWKDSLILVVEDDAQRGPDHIDATRTVALAIGPYIKRNVVISDRYDQLSMLRTIELTLGLPPLNLNDSLAVPMFNIFAEKPDFRPLKKVIPSAKLSEDDHKLFQKFRK